MVRRAAGAHRVLLQRAQRRRRLARVEDRDAAAGRVDEPARARRDAREPLQEVERRALADEQRARRCRRPRRSRSPGAARARRRACARSTRTPGSSCRNASNATSSPASTQSALTRNTPRARCAGDTVASVVTSPSRTSSSSARRDDVAVVSGQDPRSHHTGFRTDSVGDWLVARDDDLARLADDASRTPARAARRAGRPRRSASARPTPASALTVTFVIGTFSGCLASDRCLRTSNSTSVAH